MEHFNIEQTTQTGVFSQIQQCINDFKQSQQNNIQEFAQFEDNLMINLTEFKQDLKYSPEYEQIFNSNNEEAYNKSFNSTLSAAEIENDLDMDIDGFEEAEQFFQNDDLFSSCVQEKQQIVPEFQQSKMAKFNEIKPTFIQQQEINKIPVTNKNWNEIGEDYECKVCKSLSQASLSRHYKTKKHQKKEMLQAGQNFQGVPRSVQTQNYNHQNQRPISIPKTIYQPKALILDQTRINFIKRLRESRNQMIDQNRMNAVNQEPRQGTFIVVEHNKVPKPQECIQKVDVLEEFVNSEFVESFNQVQNSPKSISEEPRTLTPRTSSPSATKTAIENSIKILSKLNTEATLKSSEQTESSSNKQDSLKQLTLMDMAFRKPTEAPVFNSSQSNEVEAQQTFESDAQTLLESFSNVPESAQVHSESELAKYIQLNPEDIEIDPEYQENQPQYEIVFEDSIFTIKELKAPETTRQSSLGTVMTQKRQKRIQEDINGTSTKGYKCQFCTKCFSTMSNLRRHEHLHGSKKLHQCTVCGKEFMQKEYMKKHMTTHSRRFA